MSGKLFIIILKNLAHYFLSSQLISLSAYNNKVINTDSLRDFKGGKKKSHSQKYLSQKEARLWNLIYLFPFFCWI